MVASSPISSRSNRGDGPRDGQQPHRRRARPQPNRTLPSRESRPSAIIARADSIGNDTWAVDGAHITGGAAIGAWSIRDDAGSFQ